MIIDRWLEHAVDVLDERRDGLNAINVFPVPDSDTGTNLLHTVIAARDGAQSAGPEPDYGVVLAAAGEEALEHARGNSGTILAVMLNSMAEPLAGVQRLTAATLATALERAQMRCWSALSDPVPGTMLTVLESAARTSAENVPEGEAGDSKQALLDALDAVLFAGAEAVDATQRDNDVLAQAKVVDAGGVGLLCVLQCLRWALTGEPVAIAPIEHFAGLRPTDHEHADAMDGIEIMCSINLTPLDAAGLRIALDEMGESVIMTAMNRVDDAHRWRLHAHVALERQDEALDVIARAGDAENLIITSLRPEQHG